MADDGHRVQITLAIIGLVGALGAAVIGNWDKLFPRASPEVSPGLEAGGTHAAGPAAGGGESAAHDAAQPSIHSTGHLTIRGTWSGDLDLGAERALGADVDFWWEQVTQSERYLVPKNGAEFYVLGRRDFDPIGYAELARFPFSGEKIDGSDAPYNRIPQGTVVAYRTSDGRLGKLIVDVYGYNLSIRWVTYSR